jgi:predicted transcriptional regulator
MRKCSYVMYMERDHYHLTLPPDLIRRLKMFAAQKKRPANAIVEKALERYLPKDKQRVQESA